MAACGTAYMEHSVYPRCTQRAIMEANTMQETALLELRGICKFFPGVRALDGVDFTIRKGEIHALMGENGAGKSTLIKVLTGVYSKDEGTISMEGTPVQIRTTQDALKAGISTVYQEITLCPNLTVAENIFIARDKGPFINWRAREKRAEGETVPNAVPRGEDCRTEKQQHRQDAEAPAKDMRAAEALGFSLRNGGEDLTRRGGEEFLLLNEPDAGVQ